MSGTSPHTPLVLQGGPRALAPLDPARSADGAAEAASNRRRVGGALSSLQRIGLLGQSYPLQRHAFMRAVTIWSVESRFVEWERGCSAGLLSQSRPNPLYVGVGKSRARRLACVVGRRAWRSQSPPFYHADLTARAGMEACQGITTLPK